MPTADAASGDADASAEVVDAGMGMTDAGTISELPPIPVDDAGRVIPNYDAGAPTMARDSGAPMPDSGAPQDDAGALPIDAGFVGVDAGTDADVAPTRVCAAGRQLGGYCWFLGAVNRSCNTVCAAHGGFEPSLPFIGSRAQGGSLSRCDAVLTVLTTEGNTTSGLRQDGRGVGCHLFEGVRWWLDSPNFSSSAYHYKARLACSCFDQP